MKTCYIFAGPNGAGKTTFAQAFLPEEGACPNFINADLIAAGLSPFDPTKVQIAAGRLLLERIDASVHSGESFAFETTLSGLAYRRRIGQWRERGYKVVLFYFQLPAVEMAIERVRNRVLEGGHDIPELVIRRRFDRSWENFERHYRSIVDAYLVFDTSGEQPILVSRSE